MTTGHFRFIVILTLSANSLCPSQVLYRTDWPRINNLNKTISINTSSEHIFYKIPLQSRQGTLLYTLFCQGGSTDYLDRLSDSTHINYVGPLCFLLVEGDRITEDYSLLCEDGSAQWYSRGQIHRYGELAGTCGEYPEYGSVRHFKLRGFVLRLTFCHFTLNKAGEPITFDVNITAISDSSATSSIAEQTGFLPPAYSDTDCKNILKGNAVRRFRDKSGCWIEEK